MLNRNPIKIDKLALNNKIEGMRDEGQKKKKKMGWVDNVTQN